MCSLFTCTTNHCHQTYTHIPVHALYQLAKFTVHLKYSYHCSTSLISLARTFSSVSRKHSTRVSHVNGPRPFPPIHFSKMALLISSASCIFARSMPEMIVPLSSLSKNVPKVLYFVPIRSGMLIFSYLPGNFSSLRRTGLSPAENLKCSCP